MNLMNLLNRFISNKDFNKKTFEFIKFCGFSTKRTETVFKIHVLEWGKVAKWGKIV